MQVQELVGIVPWTFIAQICNLFIQMYLIKRFLFKPINEMLEKRRAAADAEITDAEAAKKEANAIKEEYEQNMQEAKAKANEILESARKTATLSRWRRRSSMTVISTAPSPHTILNGPYSTLLRLIHTPAVAWQ